LFCFYLQCGKLDKTLTTELRTTFEKYIIQNKYTIHVTVGGCIYENYLGGAFTNMGWHVYQG